MKNVRIYGEPPYKAVVIHGGPGAPGEMAPVANGLKEVCGVLEPLQTADSVWGQVEELYNQLKNFALPFLLIGYSWGAWLAWLFAGKYPEMVSHIVLVSSGVFDEEYVSNLMGERLGRLTKSERQRVNSLLAKMQMEKLNSAEFGEFGSLMSKADTYCYDEGIYADSPLPATPCIFDCVWPEAAHMRKSGELISTADRIKCKITCIHGENDPSPYQGVQDVLNEHGVDFDFILLDRCGHTPWKEKYKAEEFFAILKDLLGE